MSCNRLLSTASLVALMAVAPLAAQEKEKKDANLPIEQVVMFNSGVAFFEHRGKVDGNASLDLQFNVSDINDLLKSMVLEDQGGGRISTINYSSRNPITKTLRTFAIDLTSNPTLAQLLSQVRGEQIELDAPQKIVGTILGVETKKQRVGEDKVVEVEVLNLLTEGGLRSVVLENVSRIKLLNEKLDGELRQALKILALGHDTDKKTVSLNFLGAGQRNVRVGYIQNAPIWKTSYRLVLDDEKAPFLQGWAIVENTTENDWNNVQLTLISGRPISFVMDLYQPLYVSRPVVEPELYASLRPQTYGQDMANAEAEFRAAAADGRGKQLAERKAVEQLKKMESSAAGFAGAPPARNAAAAKPMNLSRGVESLAQAADVGELFQYRIETPVTLPRQQSAMLPIVNDSVKGEKVSIYNENVQTKHPLNGLQLTNSTALHLMQGPITVFDGGVYAGDAKIEDLSPGTTRLISYALDLDTEVSPESKSHPEELVKVRIAKGVLYAERKYRRSKEYTVKNSDRKAKKVLIEYPLDNNWKLTEPAKYEEKTRDRYRFAVNAEPGKPAKLNVAEEHVSTQNVYLTNLDDNSIRFYIRANVVSQQIKDALADVIKRKEAIQELVRQRTELEQKIAVIDQEQNRIRQNMQQLPRNSDLYNRYVKKFSDQETSIEQMREQIDGIRKQEETARKALDTYLLAMNLD